MRRSGLRGQLLADLTANTTQRIYRWRAGQTVPRSPQADEQVHELCRIVGFPFERAFIVEPSPLFPPDATIDEQHRCRACGALNDSPLLCTTLRVELQARGASPEDLLKAAGAMMVSINHAPELAPDKRALAIKAMYSGFGYDAELLPDGGWLLTRATIH